jgi:hypothetical protein
MDLLLLIVTAGSLGLAACMTLVAWKLRRDARRRADARVAVLEAIAFGDTEADADDIDDVHVETRRETPARARAEAGPSWDTALGSRIGRSITAIEDDEPVDHALFTPAAATGSGGRRMLVLAAVAVVMIGGISAAYAVRGDINWPSFGVTAGAAAQSPRDSVAPLELLSLRHTVASATQFTVTGLVQNPREGRSVAGLVAVVYLFDGQGRYLASGKTPIEYSALRPGDEAPFVVTIPATSDDVSRYRVGFRLEDGAVVSHVDRRGEPPASTTGEAIGDQPPSGRSRRAEG